MRCPECAHENAAEMKFCGECGTRLAVLCRECGSRNAPAQKFCGECGARLEPNASSRQFPSPDAYTPKHLAEKILTSKAALEGERKQVTVLFADLKGSMELLADRDPEEARKLLDPVLERMMEAVHHYEGTVNQVMGDGIMALFGAPIAHEDHAARACFAALRMQGEVGRYADQLRRENGVEVRIRVGVNSGDVVVRSIGSDLRMDYTAVGQTTHLAARMEQMAAPGTIRLAKGTLRLVEGLVEVNLLGPVPVKGLAEPIEVCELVGAGAARTRFEAAARHGLTRFVGRSAEMEQIRDAIGRASGGRGQVVAVVGEPGVGKSRLVWEVTHASYVHGWRVLKASSVSYGKATSYLPVIDLLKGYFGIEDRDDLREIRDKVTGAVLRLDRSLEPALLPLLALLDVPVDDAHWKELDPRQRRRYTFDALRQVLLREAREQPLLLIFEDLHWIDGETQAFLDTLIENLPAARVLLLVNYRPEYTHAWGSKTYYRQLRLDPLPLENAHELLDALLGRDAALVPLKQLLIGRTEANPLFLEESVRTLAETGALQGERGAYRLARPIEQLQLPATVQAILAARIDRLAPGGKRLLQAAAVIGKDVALPLLLAIAEAPQEEVRADLARLQTSEFLYEVRPLPDPEYTFKHALTHEVAYQGLLQDRRRALHARVTEAIERLSAERIAEQAERLAHHALRGELWEKAVAYLHQAGLRAIERGAYGEAVAYLEQALGALPRLPETRQTVALNFDIRMDIVVACVPLDDWPRIVDHTNKAEAFARSLGDQRRIGQVLMHMVLPRMAYRGYDEGVRVGQEALSIARALGDRGTEVGVSSSLCLAHLFRGAFSDAVTLVAPIAAREGELRSERFGSSVIPWATAVAYLAEACCELGRFDEAIAHAEAALRTAEAADSAYTLFFALSALGLVHLRRGDFQRATPALERCLDLCHTWQFVDKVPFVCASLGVAYALAGRAGEALPLVASAAEEFRDREIRKLGRYRPTVSFLFAGMTYLAAGRIDEATTHAREALGLARRLGDGGNEAHALCLSEDIASASGTDDPEVSYCQALAIAGLRGMRPRVAHCHLSLGKLHRRRGNHEPAQKHLTTAKEMYHEMGMTHWLGQAEAELRQLA
jgi:class 3 adenylate cyclase/tetratricopeptide (TPR) repeat protein